LCLRKPLVLKNKKKKFSKNSPEISREIFKPITQNKLWDYWQQQEAISYQLALAGQTS